MERCNNLVTADSANSEEWLLNDVNMKIMEVQTRALTGLGAGVNQRGSMFLKGQIKGLVDNIYMCDAANLLDRK